MSETEQGIGGVRGALSLLGYPRGYLAVLLLALASVAPLFVSSSFQNMLILTFIIGIGAIAWNIIGGYGGQFSLGNGVFFGTSAYVLGVLLITFELSLLPAIVLCLIATLLVAVVVGYPTFKLRSHYFALGTIVIVEGARFLARHFREYTGGEVGFSLAQARTRGVIAMDMSKGEYYVLTLAMFTAAALLSAYIRYSKLGYYLMAIRDDHEAAASLGINTERYKMYGWVVSAFLTGVAGILYAIYVQYLDPDFMFGITESVLLAVIPIIGGIGTVTGPVIGALIMWPILHTAESQFGGEFGAVTYMVYGALLILLIMYAPDGFVSKAEPYAERIRERIPVIQLWGRNTDPPWR
jgi:branched-chain amino acid transport system permease protein